MDKERLSPGNRLNPPRLSLAEEQRLAFDADQKKAPRQGSFPFVGFLYRN